MPYESIKRSIFGLISFLMAIGFFIIIIVMTYIDLTSIFNNEFNLRKSDFLMNIAIVINFLGTLSGIIFVFKKEPEKGLGYTGLTLNLIITIFFILVYIAKIFHSTELYS